MLNKLNTALLYIFIIISISMIFIFNSTLKKYDQILNNQQQISNQCKETVERCSAIENQYAEVLLALPETEEGLYINHDETKDENVEEKLQEIFNAQN